LKGALQNLQRVALGIRPKRRRPARWGKASALSPRRIAIQRELIGWISSGGTCGRHRLRESMWGTMSIRSRSGGKFTMMRDDW
jgi:hypothetical protein